MLNLRKAGAVTLAVITIAGGALAMTSSAEARYRGHRHHHHHGHGFGIGAGIATGLALGAIGTGYAYGARPGCIRNRVVGYTYSGRPIVRRVNVCY